MDRITIAIILDVLILLFLGGIVGFHTHLFKKRDHKKTEQIKEELEEEREKTNKFHVSIEEIRRMTKG